MNVLVTAGPTREYIDSVRFITNASSGTTGYAVAEQAAKAGHTVTLLTGPVALAPPEGVYVIHFTSVAELQAALDERFDGCDALVMSAAVGDFTVGNRAAAKLHRSDGPITLELAPTADVLASLGARRRADQIIIAFAVEEPADADARAGEKLRRKNADYIVVNTPAALAAAASQAAILSPTGVVLPWAHRAKTDLAREIVRLLK